VLANAVLLRAQALSEALDLFAGTPAFAVWTAAADGAAAHVVAAAGLRPDTTTTPLVRPCDLPTPEPVTGVELELDADRRACAGSTASTSAC
jgi:hypothetical protein